IGPGDDRNTVSMKAFRGETVLFEDAIVTNGLAQPLREKECSGWYQYSWSETGKRLLFESKSSCPGELSQKISGLSIINKNGEWLDIQLLQRQEDRFITLRRYAPVPHKNADSDKYNIGRVGSSRISAGTGFSISEVVELSRKVAPEVLEAALVEYHEPFPINSKTLVYLSDAGVPSQVTDLMVALSFPEKFTVEPRTVSVEPRSDSAQSEGDIYYVYPPYGHYYVIDPLFPWYWTPYTYSLYWSSGWGIWSGYYPYWGSPVYPGGVYRSNNSGRLVAGRGYTRIDQRRFARPKSGSAASGSSSVIRNSRSSPNARVYSTRGSSGSVSSVPAAETRRITSPPSPSGSPRIVSPPPSSGRVISAPSGGGGRVSTPSGGGAPSASPGGTSSGSTGRKARER
ncbi:MAG: hypothetical protein JXR49_00555, partial [Acidobacteria bacterium]|nr:hypothetical protein [Acidobacteriota bacterium]